MAWPRIRNSAARRCLSWTASRKRYRICGVSKLSIWYMLLLVIGALAVLSAQTSPQVGYATIAVDGSNRVPGAAALLSYVNSSGVLINETAVASVQPVLSGMMLVDEAGTRTGI